MMIVLVLLVAFDLGFVAGAVWASRNRAVAEPPEPEVRFRSVEQLEVERLIASL